MQILEGLLKLPENRECADCKAKYVSGVIKIVQLLTLHSQDSRKPRKEIYYFSQEYWITLY